MCGDCLKLSAKSVQRSEIIILFLLTDMHVLIINVWHFLSLQAVCTKLQLCNIHVLPILFLVNFPLQVECEWFAVNI